jgi:hypothetical protein
MGFWLPWGIAAVVTAIVFFFFCVGVADGSVSSFNIVLWVLMLLGVTGVTGGSLWLRKAGRTGLATLLALVLAVPGLLAALFLAVVLITQPRWN